MNNYLPVNPCCTEVVSTTNCNQVYQISNYGCVKNICKSNFPVTSDIVYNGIELTCTLIAPCDTISVVLQKIDAILCSLNNQIISLTEQIEGLTDQIEEAETDITLIFDTLEDCCTTTTTTTLSCVSYLYEIELVECEGCLKIETIYISNSELLTLSYFYLFNSTKMRVKRFLGCSQEPAQNDILNSSGNENCEEIVCPTTTTTTTTTLEECKILKIVSEGTDAVYTAIDCTGKIFGEAVPDEGSVMTPCIFPSSVVLFNAQIDEINPCI